MTARSYSQISLYERCPAQFNLRHNEKLDMGIPKSPQASRGTEIHESIEGYVDGTAELHPEIESYHTWLAELKEQGMECELRFCFDINWEPVDWKSEEGYIRGYIDAKIVDDQGLALYEWKTGKMYDDHAHQRQIYGIAALIMFPEFEQVEVIGIYLDLRKEDPTVLYRSKLATYKWLWTERIDKLNTDPYFAARPGPYCNWCDYAKKKGGPCRFGI